MDIGGAVAEGVIAADAVSVGLYDPNGTAVNGDLAVAQQSFFLADNMSGV